MAPQVDATEPAPARVQEEVPQPSAQRTMASSSAPKAAGLRKAKQQVVAPTGNIKVKPQKEGPSETSESQIDPAWNESVTAEALTKAWMGFIEKLRQEDRIALTATMSLGDPELRGMQVVYGVNNPLQREQMDGLRTEVLVHLKTTLKNASLELHLEMKEQAMEEKKAFLSDKDRYDMMVEKNPALDKLRKALDLDLG